ncbi:hypothetical protein JAO73_00465 [Hymenobacter sp. BT523]|uniref:hypothetical protein n=1 Tax=Hymenobacter sp. BT523 TaxID=2795725 RepID=UPI0018EA413E|nr:hypothetical protein [Hymenobacter sp. BT523]MBJ6107464.1 hypothetical protein [Hymenobacter sp. BT523]
MKTFHTVWLLLAACWLARPACGQTAAAPDPAAGAAALAQQQYNASFGRHPQLYNGPEYVDYAKRYNSRIGHQYFLAPEKQPGGVHYNGHYFANLQLAYDVVRDQVVLQLPTNPLTLRLASEQVRYFYLNDHRFVRLLADSSAGGVIQTGFYEVLADNKVQLLAKRAKRLSEQLSQRTINAEFVPIDRYFLRKSGTYYAVTGKSGVVRLLADHGKEVQQFIRDKDLKFNKEQLGPSLTQVAQYYGTLPAPQ